MDVMKAPFGPAEERELDQIFSLYVRRVAWMEEAGIRQWNRNGYLEAYPIGYYRDMLREGRLYALRDKDAVLAAAAVLESDRRWEDAAPALYVHNLLSALPSGGAGGELLTHIEALAVQLGKAFVRLDCAADNASLNRYYESRGYRPAGTCQDGPYRGVRRQKVLKELNPQ